MTPREFGSFTIWMLVVTGATHSAYAQNNSLHGAAMEVTPFMSHDSTFRWRIGAAISYAWTSRLNVETEIDSSTGINQVKGEELGASVNLLYSLRGADRVRPYVAGGAGVEQYSTSYWCACDDALERGIIIEVTVEAGVWDLDLRLMWGIVLAAVAGALLIEWRTAGQQPRTSDADGRA
jgi:opacity protein-like surface antigen